VTWPEGGRIGVPVRLSNDTRPEIVRNRNGSPVCTAVTVGIAESIVRALNEFGAGVRLGEALSELRSKAETEPLEIDISDFSDEFCAGYLKGQANALDLALSALEGTE